MIRSPTINGSECAVNITVTDIDIETVGMEVTIEGQNIDVGDLIRTIENTGVAGL